MVVVLTTTALATIAIGGTVLAVDVARPGTANAILDDLSNPLVMEAACAGFYDERMPGCLPWNCHCIDIPGCDCP